MPMGQGYSHGGSKIGGTTKSNAKSATKNSSGGNYGKPIGDKGRRCKAGNKRTKCPSDRYK